MTDNITQIRKQLDRTQKKYERAYKARDRAERAMDAAENAWINALTEFNECMEKVKNENQA